MADIHSGVSELVKAARKHYKFATVDIAKEDISHNLLLVYAVECGLKAQYLRKHSKISTAAFIDLPSFKVDNKKYGHEHDIMKWVKELSLPAHVKGSFRDSGNYPLESLHQRLRYGIVLRGRDMDSQKEQIAFLKRIMEALIENL
ncbi:MAG: hypothetical protein RIS64_919 [Bacteroidota bacterium]|jgi:hypothetical protein